MDLIASKRTYYRRLLTTAQVRPSHAGLIDRAARRILKLRHHYMPVSVQTGVPWDFIGVVHYRESTNNFAGVLHNGEHIIGTGLRTRKVPKGRGPFETWDEAAIDALRLKGLHKWRDWSPEGEAFQLEGFNGYGYHSKNHPSPYLFSGTDVYARGKFFEDHQYDPSIVDAQLGVIPILWRIRELVALEELATQSRKVRVGDQIISGTRWFLGLLGSAITLDTLGVVERLSGLSIIAKLGIGTIVVGAVGLLALWAYAQWNREKTVEDHKAGRYEPSGAAKPKALELPPEEEMPL